MTPITNLVNFYESINHYVNSSSNEDLNDKMIDNSIEILNKISHTPSINNIDILKKLQLLRHHLISNADFTDELLNSIITDFINKL